MLHNNILHSSIGVLICFQVSSIYIIDMNWTVLRDLSGISLCLTGSLERLKCLEILKQETEAKINLTRSWVNSPCLCLP